ncbi:MAG: hypothetical protein E6Q97_32440 [Desulfurellales bacterium]|nr:MAG: hypothetical protein E6Q97_32440 [Desulfurellales bacterium]
MDLLEITRRVTASVGLPRPNAVATSSDQLAQQLFSLANDTLEELCDMDWPVLRRTWDLYTVISTEQYDTPTDFKKLSPAAFWNQDQKYRVRGALTSQEWRKERAVQTTSRYKFTFGGDTELLKITPAPTVVELLKIDYFTNYRAVSADGVDYGELFQLDTDIPLVPDDLVRMGLKWRIKHAKGLEYGEDYNLYESKRKEKLAQQLSLGDIDVAVRNAYATDPYITDGYIPQDGFG